MKKLIFLVILFATVTSAYSQQQAGDFQLQAQASYFSNSFAGQSFSSGSIYFNASRFFTDNIEVGVSPFFMFSDQTTVNLSFFGNYSILLDDAKLVPYGGVQVMFYNLGSDPDFSQTGFGLKAGIRYFITENVNIDVGPNIAFLSAPAGLSEGSTLFQFTAGLGYIFGKR
ncbi:MAG: outer membrane beta-barrel protein [Cyclobacteriaceae bacterium]|nr:outer membrane beta-barrel protein [Cyclobacteriaceae bacterium]